MVLELLTGQGGGKNPEGHGDLRANDRSESHRGEYPDGDVSRGR